jgi:hypothetical protein
LRRWLAIATWEPLQYLPSVPSGPNVAESRFKPYVEGLGRLLRQHDEQDRVDLALNGGAAAAFRKAVPLEHRRTAGAFFTSRKLAGHLVGSEESARVHQYAADPACGAGDLLLAVARLLPRKKSALETLRLWGTHLIGRDLDPVLVRATRLRLALLATQVSGGSANATEGEITEALPGIQVGDGLNLWLPEPVLLLLNPPFGATLAETDWASGRTPRAAVFMARCLESLPKGSTVRAILPDVLRSGTHSQAWRKHIGALLTDVQLEIWGQFDSFTDVDVFVLRGTRETASRPIDWCYPKPAVARVQQAFIVSVGTVVPHRDSKKGPKSPFICARDLPQGGEFKAGNKERRHLGKRFTAPFVAIRRTSRPADGGKRIVATVVRSARPVLVENHLIVCRPLDRKLASCESLAKFLESEETSEALDQRIRCRHLTVGAIKELPYSPAETSSDQF